jgi:WhiB family redox-sensing transcriptional regulator
MDIGVFYSTSNDYRDSQGRQEQVAKDICRQCPVIMECRECAINFGEQHGIWGGLNPKELLVARKWRRWDRQPAERQRPVGEALHPHLVTRRDMPL